MIFKAILQIAPRPDTALSKSGFSASRFYSLNVASPALRAEFFGTQSYTEGAQSHTEFPCGSRRWSVKKLQLF